MGLAHAKARRREKIVSTRAEGALPASAAREDGTRLCREHAVFAPSVKKYVFALSSFSAGSSGTKNLSSVIPAIHKHAYPHTYCHRAAGLRTRPPMADQELMIRPDAEAQPGRALPANIEAEAAFLGAVLIDNRVIEELPVAVRPEHFFEAVLQRI